MAQIHFSVKGLIIKDKKFLVLHKVSPRCEYFDLPGGKMKNNESAEETLQREILEETSLLIKPISVLHQWDFVNQDYLIMGIIYLCQPLTEEIQLSEEHDYYEWIPLNEESIQSLTPSLANAMSHLNFDNVKTIN